MRPTIVPPSNVFETEDAANGLLTDYLIGAGNSFYGHLGEGDSDWVAVKLYAGNTFNFQVEGTGIDALPAEQAHLTLFSYNGSFVTRDDAMGDDGDGISADIWFVAEYTGIYYLKVSSKGVGDYAITSTHSSTGIPDLIIEDPEDDIADQLVNGYWENGGEIMRRFDIPASGTLEANITGLTADGQFLATEALSAWSAVTGIAFEFVTVDGDIIFDDEEEGAFATVDLDPTNEIIVTQGQINVNPGFATVSGYDLDGYGFQTYLHEIGHVLGLGHAGNYNGSATYPTDALFERDSWQATVMSYFSQEDNTDVDADFAYVLTPMIADILAIKALYGSTGALRLGDTTYGHNSNTGDFYDSIDESIQLASLANPVTFTILDDGGVDTINMSPVVFNQNINLKAGSISDTMGLIGNMSIARGTVIENVISGSGNDVLQGNGADNILRGAKGRDLLKGAGGDDVLNGGAGRDRLKGGGGEDTFLFKAKYGKDTVLDFEDDIDTIRLDAALWSGSLTAQQVVDGFARVSGSDIILDFGKHALKIKDFIDLAALADDLEII